MPPDLELMKGARYRVIREGGRLRGWRPTDDYGSEQSWSRPLRVGETLRYEGLHYSGGSDGIDVHKFTPEQQQHAFDVLCDFHPTADPRDIWRTRPDPSFLERVD